MQDILRLFLTRTLYVTLLIIGAAMVGVAFPVTPKHNSVLALLTVGIPTLALAVWARPGDSAAQRAALDAALCRARRHSPWPS